MSSYEQYLEKYCRTYRLTKEEAERHYLVQAVKKFYEEETEENKNDGT